MLIPNNRGQQVKQLIQDNLSKDASGLRGVQVQNESGADEATVLLYDYIGWPFNDPVDFAHQIMSITAKTIHLRIHSPGGSVYDAVDMLTKLRVHPANIIVHVDGLAASAATIVAMAGHEIRMTKGARFMIHNASLITWGNAHDLEADAAFLRKVDADIASIYHGRTGRGLDEIKAWMDAESWFSAEEAKENGFVTEVVDGSPAKNVYNLSAYRKAPEDLVVYGEKPVTEPARLVAPASCRARNARMLALRGA